MGEVEKNIIETTKVRFISALKQELGYLGSEGDKEWNPLFEAFLKLKVIIKSNHFYHVVNDIPQEEVKTVLNLMYEVMNKYFSLFIGEERSDFSHTYEEIFEILDYGITKMVKKWS